MGENRMNRHLFELCFEYVKCFSILECLISIEGIEAERLKLFRLTGERCRMLEQEIGEVIVENDLKNK